jgi:N,N'-diacetyllegionaminate synthase
MISLKLGAFLRGMQMNKAYVIAEAGVNHNGSVELAKKLVDVASEAGADAVKFQTFNADRLVSKIAKKANYQKKTTGAGESQYEMIKKLELDEVAHKVLISYCKEKDITFLSTPFDHESIDMLNAFGMTIFKVPSGEITNLPYLRHVGGLRKKIILSTGMSYLNEVESALDILIASGAGKQEITILHATSEYPCPLTEVNLRAMITLKEKFGVNVGYSDHTQGIEISIAAVALGASVIEKHFTLDRSMKGPDHKASLEPSELKLMVQSIRHLELAYGDGVKQPTKSEINNIAVARKSIVALRDIKAGETFSLNSITVKRPGNGISPMKWDDVLGSVAKRDFLADELIEL